MKMKYTADCTAAAIPAGTPNRRILQRAEDDRAEAARVRANPRYYAARDLTAEANSIERTDDDPECLRQWISVLQRAAKNRCRYVVYSTGSRIVIGFFGRQSDAIEARIADMGRSDVRPDDVWGDDSGGGIRYVAAELAHYMSEADRDC